MVRSSFAWSAIPIMSMPMASPMFGLSGQRSSSSRRASSRIVIDCLPTSSSLSAMISALFSKSAVVLSERLMVVAASVTLVRPLATNTNAEIIATAVAARNATRTRSGRL